MKHVVIQHTRKTHQKSQRMDKTRKSQNIVRKRPFSIQCRDTELKKLAQCRRQLKLLIKLMTRTLIFKPWRPHGRLWQGDKNYYFQLHQFPNRSIPVSKSKGKTGKKFTTFFGATFPKRIKLLKVRICFFSKS